MRDLSSREIIVLTNAINLAKKALIGAKKYLATENLSFDDLQKDIEILEKIKKEIN